MTGTLFIKKGCSTCIDAVKWLKTNQIDVQVRDMFVEPLSVSEIRTLLGSRSVSTLVSTRSPQYKSLGLDQRAVTDSEWLELMAANPYLIRRPTLVVGDQLIVGFDKPAYAQLVRA